MTPTRLYTAFHANLDFSAMPESDRAAVISRCYWPLLELPEQQGVPLGFEMSARTLTLLSEEDPEWLKRFLGLAERGLVEVVGSGWAQIVAPLAPVEVNRRNLERGQARYAEILGAAPETYFVSEQTYSEGLMPLFAEVGARRVIMEWNNPAARRPELRALRGQPVRWDSADEAAPVILWNDSIVFQKAQRVAHGVIPAGEFDALIERIMTGPAKEAICLYGGDVEIFDYRPSRTVPLASDGEREVDRLIGLISRFAHDPRFEFGLPREVTEPGALLPRVRLASAADPIPCKKQPRYNPTRWAVSGRDGFSMNTRCHALLRSLRIEAALAEGEAAAAADEGLEDLVDLWRSDLRTRATEEKIEAFETGIGQARARTRAALSQIVPRRTGGEDLLVTNPWSEDWPRLPVEIPLRMPPGRCEALRPVVRGGGTLADTASQVEVLGRHRDGSIRDALLVLEPFIPGRGTLRIALEPTTGPVSETGRGEASGALETAAVRASVLPHRGAALESLVFPGVCEASLLGTIAHGTFDEIEYTPDFYSGHVIAVSENGSKSTDLAAVPLCKSPLESGPVRDTFETVFKSPFGPWRKRVRLYRNRPRLEWIHDLVFHEARLASLRLGTFTLQPWSWDRETLRFGAVNGGAQADWFSLAGETRLAQSAAVSSTVSATSCLGATEGWVALEDAEKGILVEGDRSAAAVAPMLDFRSVDDAFFARLSHSAAETDETTASFLRGQRRFGFAVEGYRTAASRTFEDARLRHLGLAYRTEREVGLTGTV